MGDAGPSFQACCKSADLGEPLDSGRAGELELGSLCGLPGNVQEGGYYPWPASTAPLVHLYQNFPLPQEVLWQ